MIFLVIATVLVAYNLYIAYKLLMHVIPLSLCVCAILWLFIEGKNYPQVVTWLSGFIIAYNLWLVFSYGAWEDDEEIEFRSINRD
jgi:hypothetical protein